jgi:hypothetical protein
MSSPSTESRLESRLIELEVKLGVRKPVVTNNDIAHRLDAIQHSIDTSLTSNMRETWGESQKLFRELDPGIALTHQQQPLLYRRQEVLAAAPSMNQDMQELAAMLHLLKPKTSEKKPLREDQVTQAAILTNFNITPEEERRLDALRLTLEELQTRVTKVAQRTDQILESYHTIMAVATEKVVLADEQIQSAAS